MKRKNFTCEISVTYSSNMLRQSESLTACNVAGLQSLCGALQIYKSPQNMHQFLDNKNNSLVISNTHGNTQQTELLTTYAHFNIFHCSSFRGTVSNIFTLGYFRPEQCHRLLKTDTLVVFFFKPRSIQINPSETLCILNQIQICSDASKENLTQPRPSVLPGASTVCYW